MDDDNVTPLIYPMGGGSTNAIVKCRQRRTHSSSFVLRRQSRERSCHGVRLEPHTKDVEKWNHTVLKVSRYYVPLLLNLSQRVNNNTIFKLIDMYNVFANYKLTNKTLNVDCGRCTAEDRCFPRIGDLIKETSI